MINCIAAYEKTRDELDLQNARVGLDGQAGPLLCAISYLWKCHSSRNCGGPKLSCLPLSCRFTQDCLEAFCPRYSCSSKQLIRLHLQENPHSLYEYGLKGGKFKDNLGNKQESVSWSVTVWGCGSVAENLFNTRRILGSVLGHNRRKWGGKKGLIFTIIHEVQGLEARPNLLRLRLITNCFYQDSGLLLSDLRVCVFK